VSVVFWTEADQAELDLRVRDLIEAVGRHGDCPGGCDICRRRITEVVGWREDRVRKSRAEGLRREQLAFDLQLERRARLARLSGGALAQLLRDTDPFLWEAASV
jgi:hypothetical protein